MTVTATPTIDPQFAAMLVPLTEHENALLLDSLKREGCRDPLTVWAEHNVLLDGHARLRLCQEHGIPFAVREIALADRDAAREWVWQNQAGRRNLRPAAAAYTRGVLYGSIAKRPGARTDLSSGPDARKWASEDVAKLFGLDESTVRRDARFARDLDLVAAELCEDYKRAILTGEPGPVSRQTIRILAHMLRGENGRAKAQEHVRKLEREREEARKKREEARRQKEEAARSKQETPPTAAAKVDGGEGVSGPASRVSTPVETPRTPAARTVVTTLPDDKPTVGVGNVVYDHDPDAFDFRDESPASDDEPAEEPVDEDELDQLAVLFRDTNHATRLAFLGLPQVRAALDRLHALSAS